MTARRAAAVSSETALGAMKAQLEAMRRKLQEAEQAINTALAALTALGIPLPGGPERPPESAPPRDADEAAAAPAPPRCGKRAPSKMPRHLCDDCHQRTSWDPCEHCGHAAPVIATLAGIAPLPGHTDEDDD